MRLWHFELIKFLPKSQLIAQWRELNSIYKKQDNHILINYIYEYDKNYLLQYSVAVIDEMKARGYKINKWDNYDSYFDDGELPSTDSLFFKEHNDRYLLQCVFNLQEKYDRGQKDFDKKNYLDMVNYLADEHAIFI